MHRSFAPQALLAFALFLTPQAVAAQSNDTGRFVQVFEPGRVEAITDYYTPEHAGRVRNSFAVGEIGLCTATLIGPSAIITAAHCRTAALQGGIRLESYANRSMTPENSYPDRLRCETFLASAQWASGSDVSLFGCQGKRGVAPPGVYYGYVTPSPRVPKTGDAVYSLWRNRVQAVPELADSGQNTLHSPGEVKAFGITNSPAGPTAFNCAPANGDERKNPIDSQIVITGTLAKTGASGSLHFDMTDDTALVGPSSAANKEIRVSVSMAATYGQGLQLGDRMLFETLIDPDRTPPDRVPTRFRVQNPLTGAEAQSLAQCIDVTQLKGLQEADRDGDLVHDIVLSETRWDWAQPHARFVFSDPLTRARWAVPAESVVSDHRAPPLVLADGHTLPAPRQTGAVRLTADAPLTLSSPRNTLIAGDYAVALDAQMTDAEGTGQVTLTATCGDQTTNTPLVADPTDRAIWVGRLSLPCAKAALTLSQTGASDLLVNSLSLTSFDQPMTFGLAEARDQWASTVHPYALMSADGRPNKRDRFRRPNHFALNVLPQAPVIWAGLGLVPGQRYRVTLTARGDGDDATLRVFPGAQVVPLTGDWTDAQLTLTVDQPNTTFTLAGSQGAGAFVDRITVQPLP